MNSTEANSHYRVHKTNRPQPESVSYHHAVFIYRQDFELAAHGITSTTNFITIHPAILELLHAYRRTSPTINTNDVIRSFFCYHACADDYGQWHHRRSASRLKLKSKSLGYLTHANRRASPLMLFIKADDFITHAERILGNGVLIVPPHEFEHPPLLPILGN
jgi:hypothetical protein